MVATLNVVSECFFFFLFYQCDLWDLRIPSSNLRLILNLDWYNIVDFHEIVVVYRHFALHYFRTEFTLELVFMHSN